MPPITIMVASKAPRRRASAGLLGQGPDVMRKARPSALLAVPAREDRGHVVEDVHRADVAVAVVLDQAALHDVDLLLGVAVHHATTRGEVSLIESFWSSKSFSSSAFCSRSFVR